MPEVLEQNEVDALLSALGGEAEAAPDAAAATVRIFSNRRYDDRPPIRDYDFKRPERVSKDQMRALEQLHDAFARSFGAQLSGFLRTIVEVRITGIEQLTYAEFIRSLPNPTCFNLLSCEPLDGQICLEISPLIIYPIVDRLLGGSASQLYIPQRPLTAIERRLVCKITDRAEAALAEAWANITPVTFKLVDTESNPQLVQIVPPNEVVVVVGFEMKLGGRTGTSSLCIPFNVIEPVVDKLSRQSWHAYRRGRGNDGLRRTIAEKLERAPLKAAAVLAETTITLEDLLHMTRGDVITTDKPASSPIVLEVEGRRKFLAHVGQYKGNRAVKVTRPVTERERV